MEMIERINALKTEKKALVLAHNYQRPEVQDAADFVGDSLELALRARKAEEEIVVMCGVDFMAETVKLLNPGKKVLFPNADAKCPMAAQLKPKDIVEAKEEFPGASVVLYINTHADCKALADCCCTSANAAEIVGKMPSDVVLFGPDANLAFYVQRRTKKQVMAIPSHGFCRVHDLIGERDVAKAKAEHPNALLIAHPECVPAVQVMADAICSTSGMVDFAKKSEAEEFIAATEVGMLHRLARENPAKRFYPALGEAVCRNMKKITLEGLLASLEDESGEVEIPREIAAKALPSIERMFL
ncbi:quinolinate synthase [Candidatus Micrarchaeota archaeon CG10_big_fil_rev_8_21_14_0_10_59_7]|nr:MAG: quinolinate synthase [Candidatus Micrarchaeota archaeon CG10_big_fil_rev_8_21_14_0_10_59_7]